MIRALMQLAAAVLMAVVTVGEQHPDPKRLLADMRAALGGDAAISGVQAFSVDGSETRTIADHTATADIQLVCVLPDRFIRVRRISNPFGETMETFGFNGDAQIRRRDARIPYPPDPFASESPDQKAARVRRGVQNAKHEFVRLVIPMIGLPAVDPVDVSAGAPQTVDGKPADVLVLQAADGYSATLFLDASTHLPLMISWMGLPEIVMSTTSLEVVRQGQVVRSTPLGPARTGDPAAGLAMVERQLRFSDYRQAEGLNWPHRFRESVAGKLTLETTLGKFKINPKIDPKRFDPAH